MALRCVDTITKVTAIARVHGASMERFHNITIVQSTGVARVHSVRAERIRSASIVLKNVFYRSGRSFSKAPKCHRRSSQIKVSLGSRKPVQKQKRQFSVVLAFSRFRLRDGVHVLGSRTRHPCLRCVGIGLRWTSKCYRWSTTLCRNRSSVVDTASYCWWCQRRYSAT